METDNKIKRESNVEIKEIDLVELISKVWAERKFVFKVCGITAIIGIIIAFSIPKEYETKVTLVPEESSKGAFSGSIGSLAAMAGNSLGAGSSEDAISPELYPQMISSIPFMINLFHIEVETEKGEIKTYLSDYLENYQKKSWMGYVLSAPIHILKLFKDKKEPELTKDINPFWLTKEQEDVAKNIKSRIVSSVDKKTGVISIAVRMQDPLISASVADSVKNLLQEYITDYRTNKARQDLVFMEKLFYEAQQEYIKTQKLYADFVDSNMNIVMARYKAEEERLENEVNLAYGVYSQLAQQLQLAKAKVQEHTPVYAIIQPATVPMRAVKPKKIMILLFSVILGGIGASCWILFKNNSKSKEKKDN